MGVYVAVCNATNTVSATKPMWNLLGGTGRRLKLFEIIVGCDDAPADEACTFALMRTSARGTQSTTVAPNLLDPASGASIATLDNSWSVDPTITGNSQLLQWSMNQRASFRWVARPGSEIIVPAASGAGLALMSVVATSPANYTFSVFWEE